VISLDDVQAAARRLDGVAHRTPVITGRSLDEATGAARVLLKAENLQRVGAFKFRGAYNAVASLAPEDRRRGVCTVSSGNHAQALALAARLHEVPAVILMPQDAPAGKRAATNGYGAEIVTFDRYAEDREALLAQLVEERGLVPIHPYDDERVMARRRSTASRRRRGWSASSRRRATTRAARCRPASACACRCRGRSPTASSCRCPASGRSRWCSGSSTTS
jgi:threonine dehydratase